jgi:hypothetical protein
MKAMRSALLAPSYCLILASLRSRTAAIDLAIPGIQSAISESTRENRVLLGFDAEA